jgi:hypothetical protein
MVAMFALAFDSIGYTRVKLPFVINWAHVNPERDFTIEKSVSI